MAVNESSGVKKRNKKIYLKNFKRRFILKEVLEFLRGL